MKFKKIRGKFYLTFSLQYIIERKIENNLHRPLLDLQLTYEHKNSRYVTIFYVLSCSRNDCVRICITWYIFIG